MVRSHLWLVKPPSGVLWHIVVLSIIAALDREPQDLFKHTNEVKKLVDRVCTVVKSALWNLLEPFAFIGLSKYIHELILSHKWFPSDEPLPSGMAWGAWFVVCRPVRLSH